MRRLPTILLLLLVCILHGVSGIQKTLTSSAGLQDSNYRPESVVMDFLEKFTNAIVQKNMPRLWKLFLDGFQFVGCRGVYEKQEVVQRLLDLRDPTFLRFHLNHTKFINYNVDLTFTVSVRGLEPLEDFLAEFILTRDWIGSGWRLTSGRRPWCDQSGKNEFVARPSGGLRSSVDPTLEPGIPVFRFLKKMKDAVVQRNVPIIWGLFEDGFSFTGCQAKHQKKEVVQMLLDLKDPSLLFLQMMHNEYINYNVNISSTIIVHGLEPLQKLLAEVVFTRDKTGNDWRLTSGRDTYCEESKKFAFVSRPAGGQKTLLTSSRGANDPTPEVTVIRFLARMKDAVVHRNVPILWGLFEDGFLFYGCQAKYQRKEVVQMLLDLKDPSLLSLQMNHTYTNYNHNIRSTVIVHGLEPLKDFLAEFVFARDKTGKDWKLTIGRRTECEESKKFAFVSRPAGGQKTSTLTSSGGILDGFVLRPPFDASSVVRKFLALLKAVIRSKNEELLRDLFLDTFRFYGCTENYGKDQTIKHLLELPSHANTSFQLLSASFTDADEGIEYTVLVGHTTMVFHLYKERFTGNHWRLSSGRAEGCSKKGFKDFGGKFETESAYEIVKFLLSQVTAGIKERDYGKLDAVFDTDFVFRACHSIHTKEDVLNLLYGIPHGTKISFRIYLVYGSSAVITQMEMTGFGAKRVRMEFVVDVTTRKLVYGRYLNC